MGVPRPRGFIRGSCGAFATALGRVACCGGSVLALLGPLRAPPPAHAFTVGRPFPLAIVGALVFVVLLGGELDVFGLLGVLLLIGLSAKNAILYLDFVVERVGKMPFNEALVDSARLRFRPIVMTTLTVLVIAGPLVFGRGEGSEFGKRLGIVMFGGIITSAVLTFFVVPAAFFLFERRRAEKKARSEEIKEQELVEA